MNYSKFYEKHFNVKIPKNFDIHHLDGNHNNNNIENLLMIPKWCHKLYHTTNHICDVNLTKNILPHNKSGHRHNNFTYGIYSDYIKSYNECCKWMDYKEFLIGNLPNIHNINLEKL